MVDEGILNETYVNLAEDIKQDIDMFNEGETSAKWIDLIERVGVSGHPDNVDVTEAIYLLGIGDLVEQLHKSKFYSLVLKIIGEGYNLGTDPFFMKDKDDRSKIGEIKYRGDGALTLIFYKSDQAAANIAIGSISLMKKDDDKIKLLPFQEIMEQIKSIGN